MPLCAASVMVLMSKQFITHLRDPFLGGYKEVLFYVRGYRTGGAMGSSRVWGYADVSSRKVVFVSGPLSLDVGSLLDHYHMRHIPPPFTSTHSLFLPCTCIMHPLLLTEPHVTMSPFLPSPFHFHFLFLPQLVTPFH